MIDYLLLLSKSDIPFQEAQLIIHQPTLKQISYIGEQEFYTGCQFLNFSKNNIQGKDKDALENLTDFEILMTLISKKDNEAIKKSKECMKLVLTLLFPDFNVNFLPLSIMLVKDKKQYLIDKSNYHIFKNIVNEMFCLNKTFGTIEKEYNPGGPQAKALVQKFKKRQRKLAEMKNRGKGKRRVQILSRYVSILSVGEEKDMNLLMQYTIPQIYDEFNRFKLREDYNLFLKCKLAGAKDVEQVKHWMSNLYSQD